MADLKARFEQAVAESKSLPEKPDNMTLLKIYALYKQASEGDVEGKRPGFADMVGRAKWDAWNEVKGKGKDDAMQEYIDLIESLEVSGARLRAASLTLLDPAAFCAGLCLAAARRAAHRGASRSRFRSSC